MEENNGAEGSSIDELRRRYREEQQKRIRPDGMAQWRELGEELDRDPFVEPGFTRAEVVEEATVVIVGGGFAGMLTAIDLGKHGITDFRIVEKAGDFGGTWYWNRYPGCMCDVESYVYLPLLEETCYMPTEHYASATQTLQIRQVAGSHLRPLPPRSFQTDLTGAEWDEEAQRWQVTTSRGDRIAARFLVLAGGILHKAKLPGIPGIDEFAGKAFHTSRWDYGYTGGSPHGAHGQVGSQACGHHRHRCHRVVQVVPQVAAVAKELYVFQRTPSAVGVLDQQPTDVEWFKSLKPGWQHERIVNFTQAVTGAQPEVDMVADGWTEVMWVDTQRGSKSEEETEALERIDFEVMEAIRQRVDEVVEDQATADRLKPYWGKHCKRVCFHDGYLRRSTGPTCTWWTPRAVASTRSRRAACGQRSRVSGGPSHLRLRLRSDHGSAPPARLRPQGSRWHRAVGRWAQGAHTLHGVLASGFPNLLLISLVQGGFGTNFSHLLSESAKHVAHIIEACTEQEIVTIEPEEVAEEEWLSVLLAVGVGGARYFQSCTPSFYNSEQQAIDTRAARNLTYSGSLLDYIGYLERWREDPDFSGVKIQRAEALD